MDKNTLIVLGFLLLCILLSLDKKEKEGFVTINKGAFERQCAVGHEQCNITLAGSMGFVCSENPDSPNYTIPTELTSGPLFSDIFSEITLGDSPCNDSVAYPDGNTISIGPCNSSNAPYELSGCSSKCSVTTAPELTSIYNLDSVQSLKITPGELQENPDISCKNGYSPAKNICFNKDTGVINSKLESDCTGQTDVWYDDSENQSVQISCNGAGNTFVPIGCEPDCLSRNSNPSDYIINSNELPAMPSLRTPDVYRDLYNQNKEYMQITSNRPSDDSLLSPNIITDSPYNTQENQGGGLNPTNFGVTVSEGNYTDPEGQTTAFEGSGEVGACDPNAENADIRDKYYVSGLFPSCSDNEECINFNISYTPEEYNSDDSNVTPPFSLEELKIKLPTDIFQGNPSDQDIQRYRDSLYYFRGFKGSDGNYNVEGQIRCDTDSGSRYGCAIIDPSPWYWMPIGGDDVRTATGTGSMETLDCNSVCEAVDKTCTEGDIDISQEGITEEDKMRSVISKLNLIDPGGKLEMINPVPGRISDFIARNLQGRPLNFNNYEDTCSNYNSRTVYGAVQFDQPPVDYLFTQDNPGAEIWQNIDAGLLPFGFISKESSGFDFGHACLIAQNTDTIQQGCGPEYLTESGLADMRGGSNPGQQFESPICHCS